MDEMTIIFLMFALFTKHFICDFVLQAFPYQYLNKGTYGHPGGLLHALICMIGTFAAIFAVLGYHEFIWYIMFIDGVVHYHIDYLKMNFNRIFNLHPQTEAFWITLGLDQFLHYLTYIVLILLIV